MSTQKAPKKLIIRWTTLKGLTAIILFLITAALIEYVIVLYAINLGVNENPLQFSLQFPETDWIITVTISPLFHLVPIAVIITLAFSWTYLTRHVTIKLHEPQKGKTQPTKRKKETKVFGRVKGALLRFKGVAYVWQKIHFARATIKSALTVFLIFSAFVLIVSLLAYPQLIYRTVSNAYQNNPSLLNFVKGTAEALAPVGAIFLSINNALLSAAPTFRDLVLNIGIIIKPLVDLDNAGKYLAFQNIAAWICALTTLIYGEHIRKGYRRRKK
ncbi:MAG: hypothetical protein ACUVQX_02510 [Candidatus Bathycorpusculaceae bacterium]